MEISPVSPKVRNRTIWWPRHIPKGLYILPQRYFTALFIAGPFTIARKWNQPRCLSVNERITKKMRCMHIDEYDSTIKTKKTMKLEDEWLKL